MRVINAGKESSGFEDFDTGEERSDDFTTYFDTGKNREDRSWPEDIAPKADWREKNRLHSAAREKGFPKDNDDPQAKAILESGQAPQEWLDLMDHYMVDGTNIHIFARDWAAQILESGQAPKSWLWGIHRTIIWHGGNFGSDFVRDWCKQKLESGQAPQAWIKAINTHVAQYGYAPDFAVDWVEKQMSSGNISQELENTMNSWSEDGRGEPEFAKNRSIFDLLSKDVDFGEYNQ